MKLVHVIILYVPLLYYMIKNNTFATTYNYNFISKLALLCLWLVTKFNMTNIYYKNEEKTTLNGNVSRSGIDTTAQTLYRYHNDTITFIAHVIFCYISKHQNIFTMSYPHIYVDTMHPRRQDIGMQPYHNMH